MCVHICRTVCIIWNNTRLYEVVFCGYQSTASELSDCALHSPQQTESGHAVHQKPASIFRVNPEDWVNISSKTLIFTYNTICCQNPWRSLSKHMLRQNLEHYIMYAYLRRDFTALFGDSEMRSWERALEGDRGVTSHNCILCGLRPTECSTDFSSSVQGKWNKDGNVHIKLLINSRLK
jgi:hypothetical protein